MYPTLALNQQSRENGAVEKEGGRGGMEQILLC